MQCCKGFRDMVFDLNERVDSFLSTAVTSQPASRLVLWDRLNITRECNVICKGIDNSYCDRILALRDIWDLAITHCSDNEGLTGQNCGGAARILMTSWWYWSGERHCQLMIVMVGIYTFQPTLLDYDKYIKEMTRRRLDWRTHLGEETYNSW